MRQRVARAGRAGGAHDVGGDVPLGVRAHPARQRRPARLPAAVLDLRPGRRRPPHRVRDPRPRPRRQALPAARRARPRSACGRTSSSTRRTRPPRAQHIFDRKHAEVYAEYQTRLRRRRGDGLRRPAREHRAPAPRAPRRARGVPRSASSTSSSTSTRTPTRRRTRSSCSSPAATTTSPSSATPTSRCTGFAAPTSATSCSSRSVRRGHHGGARPELPQHADDPRRGQRGHRQQRRAASRRTCGPRPARGDRIVRYHAEDEGDEATLRRRHGPRPAQRATPPTGARWPCCTAPTPRAASWRRR